MTPLSIFLWHSRRSTARDAAPSCNVCLALQHDRVLPPDLVTHRPSHALHPPAARHRLRRGEGARDLRSSSLRRAKAERNPLSSDLSALLQRDARSVAAARDAFLHSALNFAAADGNEAATMALLAAGCSARNADKNGHTPLHNVVFSLLPTPSSRKAALNSTHQAQDPALAPRVVSALLKAGADVNAKDKTQHTPLLLCSTRQVERSLRRWLSRFARYSPRRVRQRWSRKGHAHEPLEPRGTATVRQQ